MLRCQGPDEPNSFVTKLVITTPALRGKVVFYNVIVLVVQQQQLQTCKGLSSKDLLTSALFYKQAHELKSRGEPCTRHVSLSLLSYSPSFALQRVPSLSLSKHLCTVVFFFFFFIQFCEVGGLVIIHKRT